MVAEMKTKVFSQFVVLSALLVSSCSSGQVTTPPTQTITPNLPPTQTATPTLTPPPTETATPTATPRPAYLDATLPWEQQDLSALSAEQIAAVDAVLANPWTATPEQKAVYNSLRAEGIAQQTGDRSLAEPMPADEGMRIAESNRRIGVYVEWAHAHGQYVLNLPLPLSWRFDNLGDVTNYPAGNNSHTSYQIEGYGDQLQWRDGWTGVGILQRLTDDQTQLMNKGRENIGMNRLRDVVYSEPFFIVYPGVADAVGDAMVLVPKTGIPQDQAMDMILRVYRNGRPRYIFFHTQFTDRTINAGDTSCMQVPATESRFCPAGTPISGVTVSRWLDIRREIKIPFTPHAWQEMMRRWKDLGYIYPMRVHLEPFVQNPSRADSTFIDGAFVMDNIVVPPMFPEEFFSP